MKIGPQESSVDPKRIGFIRPFIGKASSARIGNFVVYCRDWIILQGAGLHPIFRILAFIFSEDGVRGMSSLPAKGIILTRQLTG